MAVSIVLLALGLVLAIVIAVNVLRGRYTLREVWPNAKTGILPPVVYFACAATGLGGSSSFDGDSQWVGALAGGGLLLVLLVLATRSKRGQRAITDEGISRDSPRSRRRGN